MQTPYSPQRRQERREPHNLKDSPQRRKDAKTQRTQSRLFAFIILFPGELCVFAVKTMFMDEY
jgi:hypothetical protein